MKVLLILSICLAVFAATSAEIGSDLLSTLRIVGKLCLCDHSDPLAARFFACYDNIPAQQKDLFISCQQSAFGNALDNKAHVTSACLRPWLMKKYADCLKDGSVGNEEELDGAITTVNKCQAEVVGIN